MAHSLGLAVVAEGVECETQLQTLREMGCDEVQGYLLGRPMPPADLALRMQPRKADVPRQRGRPAWESSQDSSACTSGRWRERGFTTTK
jgi:predicted signal transduction protein with EAL and GGDEF domain